MTETERNATLFQFYFIKFIITDDPEGTVKMLDRDNGKSKVLLDRLMAEWKAWKLEDTVSSQSGRDAWLNYLTSSKCSNTFHENIAKDVDRWIMSEI